VFKAVQVIGSGRVGSAVSARLSERGLSVSRDARNLVRGPDELVLLCVPDSAIAEVAAELAPGPWVAHVSGATPLAALDPHRRRFSLHPVQTFTRTRGAEQLDGAWAAVTAESDEARAAGFWLARALGLKPFELADDARPLYHAGAAIASNYLVTLHAVAADLFRAAGAPPEALVPLMRRTIDNGFELTGPIERGDWATVETHRRAIRAAKPELEPLYDVLARATAKLRARDKSMKILRTIADMRGALAAGGRVGLVPTMGAFHAGHVSLFRAAREECDTVVVSLFVNPIQFAPSDDFARYPRDEESDARVAAGEAVDVLFVPETTELFPSGFGTWVDVDAAGGESDARPGHFRGVATVCMKLFNIVRPQIAYFGQKDAQQAAVLRRMIRDLDLDLELRILPTVRDADGLALSSRNAYLSAVERDRAVALPRALEAGRSAHAQGSDPVAAVRAELNGLEPDYVELLELGDATVLTAAARVGSTRLIDNVLLEGELR
jgi:pantoate--beta-alanine ligase